MSGKVWAVLTAAGSGSRLGADVPKALVSVGGQTLLGLALTRLLALPGIAGVVVTCLARPSWLVEIDATAVIPD